MGSNAASCRIEVVLPNRPGELARVEEQHIVWKADLVGDAARERGIRTVEAEYRPTAKNAVVSELFGSPWPVRLAPPTLPRGRCPLAMALIFISLTPEMFLVR